MTKYENAMRYISLISVSIGSKIMFMIPYVMSSYYVVFQKATQFNNAQIGHLMTVLGVVSFVMFLPGGFLADILPIRFAVPAGLIGCGLIGLYIVIFQPNYETMLIIYGIIPCFITLLTWSSSMKAIRMLGTDDEAGKNQAIRSISIGVVSLSTATFALILLSRSSNELMVYRFLMITYSAVIMLSGIVFSITFKPVSGKDYRTSSLKLRDLIEVIKVKEVLLIGYFGSVVYISAISIVYMQPYLAQIFDLSSASTSVLGVACKEISILSAPAMVWMAAKFRRSQTKVIAVGLFISALCFAFFLLMPQVFLTLWLSIVLFLFCGFWIMGSWILQFVPISEVQLPIRTTGTAIGIISIIVHLGDMFFYSLCGSLIDQFGLIGYRIIFLITAILLLSAVYAAIIVNKRVRSFSE